ncbi:MAG: DUF1573 domain-containing protein, partial [Tannerella sp.]|nr:DUF1573 domain-containing protein [Tannerella sp.]
GCTSCKLQLGLWKKLIATVDSISGETVPFLFFFHPKDSREIQHIFKQERFDFPVCIDLKDELNKLNLFPSDMTFQTFLLDKDNKVAVIGNPVHSLAVKDLYLKQITVGKLSADNQPLKTTAEAEQTEINLGSFEQSEKKTAVFTIKNTGNNPLVLVDAATTCGCATPTFDKHPAKSGEILLVKVDYQAKDSGFFSEMITVKSNTDKWIKLIIKGQVL